MRRGFTLVEVIVAVIILTFGALALAGSSAHIAQITARNKSRSSHQILKRDSIEIARSRE